MYVDVGVGVRASQEAAQAKERRGRRGTLSSRARRGIGCVDYRDMRRLFDGQ
jgi:hypothetical protein